VETLPQLVVHGQVVEGEAFGELGRQTFPAAEPPGVPPVAHRGVEGLVGAGHRGLLRPGVLAHRAVVDEGDGPASRFPLSHRELRVVVDSARQLAHPDGHLGTHEGPVDVLAHALVRERK